MRLITMEKKHSFVSKCLLLLSLFISISFIVEAKTAEKRVNTWYVYKDGVSSFKDISPYKDVLNALSIFGNPPKTFIDECHNNGIEVYHAVSDKETSINTQEKRDAMVRQYLDKCLKENYDGIDLDYEGLSLASRGTYSLFLKQLSKSLHKEGKKMSQCVGFYGSLYRTDGNPNKIFYDVKVLAKTCDYIRVMCYDMCWAMEHKKDDFQNKNDYSGIGGTSCYPFVKTAMEFWKKYIPKNKLVAGLPAYSNDYDLTTGGEGIQVYAPTPLNPQTPLAKPGWMWYDKINIYIYKDTNDHIHLFYASDAKSTQSLLELMDELELDNIGFWHYSSVSKDMWDVTRTWINQPK